jgi:hypothetical protein
VLTCWFVLWLLKASFSFDVAVEVMTELVSQHEVSYVFSVLVQSTGPDIYSELILA